MRSDNHLNRLMTWLSPSFPVGAFAYSHGLEYAVCCARIRDQDSLVHWVEGILKFGGGRVDATLFRRAWESVSGKDDGRLASTLERARAQRGSAELALESAAQGRAFLETVEKAWPELGLREVIGAEPEPAYAVVVAAACALAQIPLSDSLIAYMNAFAANLVSSVVRLVPLGQTDGQRAMARLEASIIEAVIEALNRDSDDFGAAAVMVDWASIQHETQYSRMFRS